jgi:hypothetical protein
MKFKNLLVELVKRPRDIPMAVLGFLVLGIHKVFLSWWLDKRLARRHDRLLVEEIREDLEFLFNEFGAQVVPNEKETPPYFDWAQATVVTDDLRFSFTRDRGMIFANVAPKRSPNDWQELSAVLTVITMTDGSEREVEFTRLPTIAAELKPQMARVTDALSEGNFKQTMERVSNVCKRRNNQARLRLQNGER